MGSSTLWAGGGELNKQKSRSTSNQLLPDCLADSRHLLLPPLPCLLQPNALYLQTEPEITSGPLQLVSSCQTGK